MSVKEVVSGLYLIKLGPVNAYLIDDGEQGLTLIDSGFPKNVAKIGAAIRSIGREPGDISNILLTHAHPDHLGGAAQLSGGAIPVSIHDDDAGIARAGIIHQTMSPGPGLINQILFRVLIGNKPAEFPSFEPDRSLRDGKTLDVAGEIEVIHTPGHTPGHVSLLWKRDRGVLFAGDIASNMFGLGYMLGYDDLAVGKTSLAKVAQRDFEVAVFGHGGPITSGASGQFAKKFG